jgi:hypothetical protein
MSDSYGWLKSVLEAQGQKLGESIGPGSEPNTEVFRHTPNPDKPGEFTYTTVKKVMDAQGNVDRVEVEVTKVDPNDPPPYVIIKLRADYPEGTDGSKPPIYEELEFPDKQGNPRQKFERTYELDEQGMHGRRCKRVRELRWNPTRPGWDLVNDQLVRLILPFEGDDSPALVALAGGFILTGVEIGFAIPAEPEPPRDFGRQQAIRPSEQMRA